MARPQGRQSLGAGARERLWAVIDALPTGSAVEDATALWLRATFDSLSIDATDAASAFEALSVLREQHLPSPAVLNAWMHAVCDLRYTHKAWEARVRTWVDHAWDQGVRPDASDDWGDLRGVIAPIRVAHAIRQPQVCRWLDEAFACNPPSPDWMCAMLAESRFEHHEQGIDAVFRSMPPLLQDYVWTAEDVSSWQALWPVRAHSLDKKSEAIQLQVRTKVLAWGLANGLAPNTLLMGPRAFLPMLMESIMLGRTQSDELLMEMFGLAFQHGLSLRSPVNAESKPWSKLLEESRGRYPYLPQTGWTPAQSFWTRRQDDVERMEATARAQRLEKGWVAASPKPSSPVPSRF